MTPYNFVEHLFTDHADVAYNVIVIIIALLLVEIVRTVLSQRGQADRLEDRRDERQDRQFERAMDIMEKLVNRFDGILSKLTDVVVAHDERSRNIPADVAKLMLPSFEKLAKDVEGVSARIRETEQVLLLAIYQSQEGVTSPDASKETSASPSPDAAAKPSGV